MTRERALIVLTPYESRRLLAKAVMGRTEVTKALADGWVVVATGSTTAYVAEELLGQKIEKENYISGHITGGETWGTPDNPDLMYPVVFYQGAQIDISPSKALKEFGAGDVFIKGANAVDPTRKAAIFMANEAGGTIGNAIGYLRARGSALIVPVGLEKLIASVDEAAWYGGISSFRYTTGTPIGIMPLLGAQVITETDAFSQLFGVQAFHIGSGGIAGSEGAVTIVIEGQSDQVGKAYHFVEQIKGEAPLRRPKGTPKH